VVRAGNAEDVVRQSLGLSAGDNSTHLSGMLWLYEPGTFPVTASIPLSFYLATSSFNPSDEPVYIATKVAAGVVEVIDDPDFEPVELKTSRDLDASIMRCMRMSEVEVSEENRRDGLVSLGLEFHLSAHVPISIAFDVIAEVPGREASFASPAAWGGRAEPCDFSYSLDYEGDVPDRLTIILRSSRAAAWKIPKLREIWGGELRFLDVTVEPVPRLQYGEAGKPRFAPETVPRPAP